MNLKRIQAVALPQLLDNLIETGLQGLWGDRVEHQANVVVGLIEYTRRGIWILA